MTHKTYNIPDFDLTNPRAIVCGWFWNHEPAHQGLIDATRAWCGWNAHGRWCYRIETRDRVPLKHPYADGRLLLCFEDEVDAAALRLASAHAPTMIPCR